MNFPGYGFGGKIGSGILGVRLSEMQRRILISLATILLSGCSLPWPATNSEITPLPTVAPLPEIVSPEPVCGYVWARQPLPELSSKVEESLRRAGLPIALARAEAYGENCVDENGHVVYFITKETDFRIILEVYSLSDEAELGRLLDTTLAELDEFPPGETPGPLPGYVGISFMEFGGKELNLWFTVARANELRQQGLGGVELLIQLINQSRY
jgi:hypothetical protein